MKISEANKIISEWYGGRIDAYEYYIWNKTMFKKITQGDNFLERRFVALCMWPDNYAMRLSFSSTPVQTWYVNWLFCLISLSPSEKAIALARAIKGDL